MDNTAIRTAGQQQVSVLVLWALAVLVCKALLEASVDSWVFS